MQQYGMEMGRKKIGGEDKRRGSVCVCVRERERGLEGKRETKTTLAQNESHAGHPDRQSSIQIERVQLFRTHKELESSITLGLRIPARPKEEQVVELQKKIYMSVASFSSLSPTP